MATSIIEKGIEAAVIAQKDYNDGLKSAEPNSTDSVVIKSIPRITAMLNNVMESAIDLSGTSVTNTNYGYLFPWHAACIATWYKEAGIPIPPVPKASSANGWISFYAGADQFSKTPTIGSVVVYGTTEQTIEANHLGLVVKIDGGVISALEVVKSSTTRTLELVTINTAQVDRYILPAAFPETKKNTPAEVNAAAKDTGEFYYPDPNDATRTKQHLVYNQKSSAAGAAAPWALHCYGPLKTGVSAIPWDDGAVGATQNSPAMKAARRAFNLTRESVPPSGIAINEPGFYTDLTDSGCGLHAAAAVFRMLTGNEKYTPGYLAEIGGDFHQRDIGTYHAFINNNGVNSLVYKCGCKFVKSIDPATGENWAIEHMKNGGFIIAAGGGPGLTTAQKTDNKNAKAAKLPPVWLPNGLAPFSGSGHFIYLRLVIAKTKTWYVGNSYTPENSKTPYKWSDLLANAYGRAGKSLKLYAISKA